MEKSMKKDKLTEKLKNRIGMTVFTKDTLERGFITSFAIVDNPDGTFSVNYLVRFDNEIKYVHESNIVLLRGTEE